MKGTDDGFRFYTCEGGGMNKYYDDRSVGDRSVDR